MNPKLVRYLAELKEDLSDFSEFDRIDVISRTVLGDTPLHVAAGRGEFEIAKLLIENGADVGAKGEYDHTPLHEATRGGYSDIVNLLIEHGADVTATNS